MSKPNKRYLLTTKAEDLLSPKPGDTARSIASGTLSNQDKDLVSDPARSKTDTSDVEPIDKAAMGGKEVHQEAKLNKNFHNKAEQEAFAMCMAAKELINPMSGESAVGNDLLMELIMSSHDFKHLRDNMSSYLVSLNLLEREDFMKSLKSWTEKASSIKEDDVDLLLWRALSSRLQPVM